MGMEAISDPLTPEQGQVQDMGFLEDLGTAPPTTTLGMERVLTVKVVTAIQVMDQLVIRIRAMALQVLVPTVLMEVSRVVG